ncbi:carboxylesterase family protein-like protein [Morchella snyderi]|nr:carboxylesterase family protein-like protein [Morchella snyderi]
MSLIELQHTTLKKGDYYVYRNIRYAAPPTGKLRFAAPQPPLVQEGIQTGYKGHSCVQEIPDWISNVTSLRWMIKNAVFGGINDNEDCLFLDVAAPKNATKESKLPVIVWIYGGGYIFGRKDWYPYNPTGMMRRTEGGVVYVAMNYRMGAYGFMAGPLFSQERKEGVLDAVSNAALHDQRYALHWVQKYIAEFGGDPDNVTIMGESAGGGSVLHQMIWQDKEEEKVPFKRAIPQSPGWVPNAGGFKAADDLQDATYKRFLRETGCLTLACLRAAPSWLIKRANMRLIRDSPHGTFTFGPAVDRKYIPDLPGRMLRDGKFSKDLEVLVGGVGMEGAAFADKSVDSDEKLEAYLKSSLPLSTQATRDTIKEMYPLSKYNGNWTARVINLAGESFIDCNAYMLGEAYGGKSYHYMLNRTFVDEVEPAGHGADVKYTFYNNWPLVGKANAYLAMAMQSYQLSFWSTGDPNKNKPQWADPMPKWGDKHGILRFDGKTWVTAGNVDDETMKRCEWWSHGYYANPDDHESSNERELK